MVETALRVALRAPVGMHCVRLGVPAGKLDVCNLACTYGREGCSGASNNKIPRRCSRLGVSAEISTYRHKV